MVLTAEVQSQLELEFKLERDDGSYDLEKARERAEILIGKEKKDVAPVQKHEVERLASSKIKLTLAKFRLIALFLVTTAIK